LRVGALVRVGALEALAALRYGTPTALVSVAICAPYLLLRYS
jgi:hypothetical protein